MKAALPERPGAVVLSIGCPGDELIKAFHEPRQAGEIAPALTDPGRFDRIHMGIARLCFEKPVGNTIEFLPSLKYLIIGPIFPLPRVKPNDQVHVVTHN